MLVARGWRLGWGKRRIIRSHIGRLLMMFNNRQWQLPLLRQQAFFILRVNPSTPDMKDRIVVIIAIAALLACAIGLAASRSFYTTSVDSLFFSIVLFSVTLIHFAVRPLRDAARVLALAALLAFLEFYIMRFSPGIVPVISLLGMSSLTVLGATAVWEFGSQRRQLTFTFIPALLFVTSDWWATTLLAVTSALHPKTLDLYLYSFDASLGLQLSFVVGRWFLHLGWLRAVSMVFYVGLPVVIGLVYGQQLRVGNRSRAISAMIAFLITGPIGLIFYNILPAAGPAHVFNDFPLRPLSMGEASRLFLVPIKIAAPPNAIPSLHMAWVLLAWWNSKGLATWCRRVALAFVVFTVLATLGTGEHYFVDLVVAVPFAVMVQAIAQYTVPLADRKRSVPLLAGLLITLAWFTLLSFGVRTMWVSPVVPWGLMVATLAACFPLQRQLMSLPQAEQSCTAAQASNPAKTTAQA